jgi:subtilisin-like proprotein convertase family protein
MKTAFTHSLHCIVFLFIACCSVSAQTNYWSAMSQSQISQRGHRVILPKQYRSLRLDTVGFKAALRGAPKEFTEVARNNPLVILVPMPDGSFARFKIVETSILQAQIAAAFPNIKTYGGQGIDDPYATIKLDWTDLGFHAMIFSRINGSVLIDPFGSGTSTDYISYDKKDISSSSIFIESSRLSNRSQSRKSSAAQRTAAGQCIGTTLRTYRLAVACTAEYTQAVGGTQSKALSAIVTTINRVDGVYETEVDIRLTLINNETKIIFTNTSTQPFKGNNDANILIDESQKVIDSLIGSANYDIGHTFSTGAGGLAQVGVVCDNTEKAMGVTGSSAPTGDPFDIDYVAHEMGHQFGATHTFNAETGNCGNNGDTSSNVEPGSGVTIMAYAGICDATNNILPHSIPYFHPISIGQITTFITNAGNSCAVKTATGNKPPVVNAGSSYTIPKSTPFMLTGSATDPDGDPLTYSWDEMDNGGPFGDWNTPSGQAPLFRSFPPQTTPTRYFPQPSDLENNTTTMGELLPSYSRTLKFRLTARDNRAGGGGVCFAETTLTVDGNAGPLLITAPNSNVTIQAGSFYTITWNVAKTNLAPINCTNVAIDLSTDGGATFPYNILSSTPNDGHEEIIVPNNLTTKARIRVRALNNIFFDISDSNFTINNSSEKTFVFNNPDPVTNCNGTAAGTVISTNGLNGFSDLINLSASGNPSGTTVVFGGNPIRAGASDSITLKGTIPHGIFDVTITGTSGSIVKSRVIRFIVGTPTTAPVNVSPANNSIGNSLTPTFTWHPAVATQLYTLNISTSSSFATSVQTIDSIADTTYTLTKTLSDNSQYYWRVVPKNQCGAGTPSTASLFKTYAIVCGDTVYSKDVPKTIDTVVTTVTSTLNITSGGAIQDVNVVGLRGKHSYIGDLTVSLISPSNTSVTLFSNECNDNKDFDISFDDQASHDIMCPINDKQVSRPTDSLSKFNNENSTGTWTLKIQDNFDGDGGSLSNWGLRICISKAAALPVNWLSFTATKNQKNTVELQWATTNEINNSYYEIEKSSDGASFSNIGKINAGNNPASIDQYVFNDVRPYEGINYYRLKQVDKDGRFTYSKIVSVTIDALSSKYLVYPNPAIDLTTVKMLSDAKDLSVKLTDASAKVVYKKTLKSIKAGEELQIPIKGLARGLYILTLSTQNGIANEKILVQ